MKSSASESPFKADEKTEATDRQLVSDTLAGSQEALEALVGRHQPWIYNLAFRMVMVPQDAEDVTQEVLIKMMTKLGSYDPDKAAFRTWLYRIVTNHVINMKTRGYEAAISGFDEVLLVRVSGARSGSRCLTRNEAGHRRSRHRVRDGDAPVPRADAASGLHPRGRIRCFRCHGRRDPGHVPGLLPERPSPAARAKLHQYMSGNCSLVNPEAPCHCRKKVKSMIDSGAYSADKLVLPPGRQTEVAGDRW